MPPKAGSLGSDPHVEHLQSCVDQTVPFCGQKAPLVCCPASSSPFTPNTARSAQKPTQQSQSSPGSSALKARHGFCSFLLVC